MLNIKTVTVIGSTGTMGANVAGIFASFGNAKVFCVARNKEAVLNNIDRIVSSVRADSIRKNLVAADFSELPCCVAQSDLVFESVTENLEIKEQIAAVVAKNLKEGALSCTGSSGLRVTSMAECYPEKLRSGFYGVHMFNPPYAMPLCELIATEYCTEEKTNELKEYLSKVLLRNVVLVKDSPAFLANRIGFYFINSAMQAAEKYKDYGGIDYIDSILGPFTGRAMAPLTTADFVGLDVHKAIVENIKENAIDYANDAFILPEFANKLIGSGKLGRKTGEGLYKTIKSDGKKIQLVYDINSGEYREKRRYDFPFAVAMKKRLEFGEYNEAFKALVNDNSQEASICLKFLLSYIVYGLYASKLVCGNLTSADHVMANGFNWCPPIALFNGLSEAFDVKTLIKQNLNFNFDADELLDNAGKSAYDYRPYFKS